MTLDLPPCIGVEDADVGGLPHGKAHASAADKATGFGGDLGERGREANPRLVRPLEQQRQQAIHTGRQTVSVVVDQAPAWVGVDPYNKRIDRISEDNLAKVDLK
jgi:hypothetical protein